MPRIAESHSDNSNLIWLGVVGLVGWYLYNNGILSNLFSSFSSFASAPPIGAPSPVNVTVSMPPTPQSTTVAVTPMTPPHLNAVDPVGIQTSGSGDTGGMPHGLYPVDPSGLPTNLGPKIGPTGNVINF